MDTFFNELFMNYLKESAYSESVERQEKEIEVEMYEKQLKENLSKEQKKLLLRIGDAKDLIAEVGCYDGFMAGFKLGLKVGYEVNRNG